VMARFGSAARGDPLYEVGVVIGRLLRTVFLADYFVNPVFRREILRVLNRGEATNALKRLIYTGRVANYQAKSEDEMQAVADALSLLANIVMAWNTAKMQAIFDRWAQRRSGAIHTAGIDRADRPDAHRGPEHARHLQLSDRAIRCRLATVPGNPKNSCFGSVDLHWWSRKMRTLKGNRNRPGIIHLHGSPQKTPGNDGCFYRMLLH
jgi:hypothetical protein